MACLRGSEVFVEIAKNRNKALFSIEQIVTLVAQHVGCKKTDITHAKRGRVERNLPRWMALKLAQDFSGENLKTIAKYFNVEHYSTVSRTIGRLKNLMAKDAEVAEFLKGISQDLSA